MNRATRIAGACVVLVALANLSLYLQVRALTVFAAAGVRTARPERLDFGDELRLALTGATVPRPVDEQHPNDVGLEYSTFLMPASVLAPL